MTASDRAALDALMHSSWFHPAVFLGLNPAATFQDNWHIEALAYHLELVRLGRIRRLIINLPPRSFKSTICSVASPAFALGQDPTKRIINVS